MFEDDVPAEPLLSTEETAALLDAMREEELGGGQVNAQPMDLASPEGPLRDAVHEADVAAEAIGTALRRQIILQLGIGIETAPSPAEIVPREVLANALDPNSLLYTLRRSNELYGLVSVDSSLSTFILDRCLGVEKAEAAVQGTFSSLDRELVSDIPRALASAAARKLLSNRKVAVVELEESEVFGDAVRFAPMLRLTWRISHGGEPVGDILLALTPTALSGVDTAEAPAPSVSRRALSDRVTMAEVSVVAVLGRTVSTIRELLKLEAGDVLRLDGAPEDPLGICVEEVVVVQGMPVVHRGDLAVQITNVCQRRNEA